MGTTALRGIEKDCSEWATYELPSNSLPKPLVWRQVGMYCLTVWRIGLPMDRIGLPKDWIRIAIWIGLPMDRTG